MSTTPSTGMSPSSSTTMSSQQSQPLMVGIVTRYYMMDPKLVSDLQAKGWMAEDFATLGSISARSGKPVAEIAKLHTDGLAWADVGSRYNVAMSDIYAPTPMVMAAESESFNRQFVRQYYGLSESDVDALKAHGMGWGEIYMTANIASRSNRSATEVAVLRNQGMSWSDIGSRYNIAMVDLSTPFIPVGRVAGVTEMVTVGRPGPVYSRPGIVVLTEREAEMFRAAGYSWRDIAIATNIAMRTGDWVGDLLRRHRETGQTWSSIAVDRGLRPSRMFDVSSYPYRRDEPRTTIIMRSDTMSGPMQPVSGTIQPSTGKTQPSTGMTEY